jgi:outer membrane beta-barrel protein
MEVDQGSNTAVGGPAAHQMNAKVIAKAAPVPLLDVFAESVAKRFTEGQRMWGVRIGVVVLGSLWLFLMAAAWSQAAEPESSPQSSDEYNFKWLDPDKKIYVLQNRRYQKTGHALFSVTGGPDFGGNAYETSWSVTPRLNYFFNESWGIEFFFTASSNSPNNTFAALQNTGAPVFPVIRKLTSEYGGLLYWSPWYAKINVFNEILYFDWLFGVGAGEIESSLVTQTTVAGQPSTTTTGDTRAAFFATTGQQFYLSDRFVIRWDLTGMYYSAPIFGTTGNSTLFSDYRFELGLGVRL